MPYVSAARGPSRRPDVEITRSRYIGAMPAGAPVGRRGGGLPPLGASRPPIAQPVQDVRAASGRDTVPVWGRGRHLAARTRARSRPVLGTFQHESVLLTAYGALGTKEGFPVPLPVFPFPRLLYFLFISLSIRGWQAPPLPCLVATPTVAGSTPTPTRAPVGVAGSAPIPSRAIVGAAGHAPTPPYAAFL